MTTASPLEIVWTVAALLGVLIQAGLVWQAVDDWRAARVRDVRWRTALIAGQNVRHAADRLLTLLSFLVIGVVALAVPEPQRAEASALGVLVTVLLLLVEALIVLDSLLDYIDRRRLLG